MEVSGRVGVPVGVAQGFHSFKAIASRAGVSVPGPEQRLLQQWVLQNATWYSLGCAPKLALFWKPDLCSHAAASSAQPHRWLRRPKSIGYWRGGVEFENGFTFQNSNSNPSFSILVQIC